MASLWRRGKRDTAESAMNRVCTIDDFLAYSGIAADVTCLLCLASTGTVARLRWFSVFVAFLALMEPLGMLIFGLWPTFYWVAYVTILFSSYFLELFVMRELVQAKAGYFGPRVIKATDVVAKVAGGCFILLGILFTGAIQYRDFDAGTQLFLHLDLAFAIFRVLGFLLLLFMARVFYSAVYDVEDDVIAALALYAVVALVAGIAHEYNGRQALHYDQFILIERARISAWIGTLLFIGLRAVYHYRRTASVSV